MRAVQESKAAQEMTPQAGQVPCLIKQGERQVSVLTKGQATQVTIVEHTVPVSCTVASVQDTGTVLILY